ncbi:MAG: 4-hydroxythreonine-4-phosphate dehydrogenase PdxA [Alphaproteobacteria bacterium]|nr:4-hydroxythreonine-4-phosphate dehydrogenase PdxA [Alphaproteobacteria bacterium]
MPRPIAVTMGEPAGIGGQIALKAWIQRRRADLPPFFLIDDLARLQALTQRFNLAVPLQGITDVEQAAAVFDKALPVLALPVPLAAPVVLGQLNPANAPAVLASIEQAVTLSQGGQVAAQVAAMVTNPIHKAALMDAGFSFTGHTDYIADLCGQAGQAVMMLANDQLRVALATIHLPLTQVSAALSTAGLVQTATTLLQDLQQRFGLPQPRLAVAGLNPHAGEQGKLGGEEKAIIIPAIAQLQAAGWQVTGPFAADSLFHAAARQRYDAVLAMYHDQGLTPVKTLDFGGTVNVTLGLSIVRTSPDHGTALDIAAALGDDGQGLADPASLIAAIRLAARLGQK